MRMRTNSVGFRRTAAPVQLRNNARTDNIPGPNLGWVLNENLAKPRRGSARQLDNWFPLPDCARTRNGSERYQKVSTGSVLSLFRYKSGTNEKFFASDETGIFDITTVSDADTIPSALIQDQTSGYYSTHQFGTSGGEFLVVVNGTDVMWQYDGTDVYPVNTGVVSTLDYDGGSAAFVRGETVTGAGGASATVLAVNGDATSGTLYIGPVTSGPFVDDEVLTGGGSGAAVADGAESSLSSVAITGVATDDLSFVWSFASRLFFVEKNTMSAWYLPVNSVGGAAAELRFSSIFQKGGSLLFGASWSIDAGDGPDDLCVFVTTEGEVLIYQGTDPSSASTWSKVGLYDIGKPMGLNATIKAGGDLLIATDVGMVPLSSAIQKDVAALSLTSVSRPIEPAWKAGVANRGALDWEVLKWTNKSMMIVSQPRSDDTLDAECFVANLETGAWARFTGWDPRCLGLYGDDAYFGANDGYVWQMESSGADDGEPYVCTYVPQFDHLKMPGVTKTMQAARANFISNTNFNYRLSCSVDYNISLPTAPTNATVQVVGGWGSGLWGSTFIWAAKTDKGFSTRWASIGRTGFIHAPQLQITLGDTQESNIKLLSTDITHVPGGTVV